MKRLAHGASAWRADLWRSGWLGISLAVAALGCSHAGATGSTSATTPEDGSEATITIAEAEPEGHEALEKWRPRRTPSEPSDE